MDKNKIRGGVLHPLRTIRKKQRDRMYELPGFRLIDLLNPYYIDRKTIYDFVQRAGGRYHGGDILDFGCGSRPYEKLFTCKTYTGCDIYVSGHPNDDKKADVYYDGHTLPFEAEHFDVILSTQVLEHVEDFEEIFGELVRVLKKNGILILTVPFCFEEHEKPYDFRRFTGFGIKKIFEENGIEVLELEKSTNYKTAVMYMQCMYRDNQYRKKHTLYRFIARYVSCVVNNLKFILWESKRRFHQKEDDDMGINFFIIGKKRGSS